MQQLSQNLRQIEPLVRHGIDELREGATLEHTLREVAVMGALIGAGVTANQAIQTVERLEAQLLGGVARERGETMYHPGVVQQGYVQPGIMPQAYVQPGYAAPYGYSKAPTMYGRQMPMTYAPMGNVWMGK